MITQPHLVRHDARGPVATPRRGHDHWLYTAKTTKDILLRPLAGAMITQYPVAWNLQYFELRPLVGEMITMDSLRVPIPIIELRPLAGVMIIRE